VFNHSDLPFALGTAQATLKIMKILFYILIALLPLFCTSCWTHRLGPGFEGPIVKDRPPHETTLMTGKMAVNHLTTSLVMKGLSDKEKPRIINDFVVSSRKVNHYQMQVWRRIINMNMIIPISDKTGRPAYKLSSEITRLPERVNGRIKYSWIMSMDQIGVKKDIWREEIEFGE
jgi:hypothetical protein